MALNTLLLGPKSVESGRTNDSQTVLRQTPSDYECSISKFSIFVNFCNHGNSRKEHQRTYGVICGKGFLKAIVISISYMNFPQEMLKRCGTSGFRSWRRLLSPFCLRDRHIYPFEFIKINCFLKPCPSHLRGESSGII